MSSGVPFLSLSSAFCATAGVRHPAAGAAPQSGVATGVGVGVEGGVASSGMTVSSSLKSALVTRPCVIGSGEVEPAVRVPIVGSASLSARSVTSAPTGCTNVKVT